MARARAGSILRSDTENSCSSSARSMNDWTTMNWSRRFPQLELGPIAWGILEPDAGVLMARRAVQAVVAQARADGVDYLEEAIAPPSAGQTRLNSIKQLPERRSLPNGSCLHVVHGCRNCFLICSVNLIHVTRQEVFFFGVPPGDESFKLGALPAWIDFNDLVYGIPNLDGRGFKLAIDAHGPEFDPDTGERVVSASGLKAVREYLARRIPLLADAPVTETRVCQYENTSNGDFLIDRHPEFENVWLVGGGSGHGFKHGPVVGEYVAEMMSGKGTPEPRFSLARKRKCKSERSIRQDLQDFA